MVLPLNDVVVVVPGILGSTLQRDGRDVWAPSGAGVLGALRTFGRSVTSLTLPPDLGDEHPDDHVSPGRLMPDLHIVPGLWTHNLGYDRLLSWLRSRFHVIEPDPRNPDLIPNVLTFPYDWRLSNRFNAKRMRELVEPALERWRDQGGDCADAKLVFVCHSMGGLVARWYVSQLGGDEVTRRLITFGTPFRGSVNALDQLVNGVEKGWGPFKLDLTTMLRSLVSVYQLLPEYECIELPDGGLAKTTEVALPGLASASVADGMHFHETMNSVTESGVLIYPFVGYGQPTATTAALRGGVIVPIGTFEREDQGGDGTVPRLSAAPKALEFDDPSISPVAEQHGTLQHNAHVFDRLEGILRAPRGRKPRGDELADAETTTIGIAVPDQIRVGETVDLMITGTGERLVVSVVDEHGQQERAPIAVPRARRPGGRQVRIPGLAPGAHVLSVQSDEGIPVASGSVSTAVLVWDEEFQ